MESITAPGEGNNQKDTESKLEQLKKFVRQSKYIDLLEQPIICGNFGLPYRPSIFRNEYTSRIKTFLKENTTTASTVSKVTGIPQKYICQVKRNLEEKGKLKIVKFDRCPTTGSSNVQFLTTNLGMKKGEK